MRLKALGDVWNINDNILTQDRFFPFLGQVCVSCSYRHFIHLINVNVQVVHAGIFTFTAIVSVVFIYNMSYAIKSELSHLGSNSPKMSTIIAMHDKTNTQSKP